MLARLGRASDEISVEAEQIAHVRSQVIRAWAAAALGVEVPPEADLPPLVANAFHAAQEFQWLGIVIDDELFAPLEYDPCTSVNPG